jgi:hypothetical protein
MGGQVSRHAFGFNGEREREGKQGQEKALLDRETEKQKR